MIFCSVGICWRTRRYQIEALAANVPGAKVGVRFNPGLGSGGTAKTNVGGPSSSFGIWHGEFAAVVKAASNLDVVRVHTHIGSGSDPAVWTRVARLSLDLCERLGDGVRRPRAAILETTRRLGERRAGTRGDGRG